VAAGSFGELGTEASQGKGCQVINLHAAEKRADEYQARYPLTFKAAYPKNIAVPKGYMDPRLMAATMIRSIQLIREMGFSELAHKTGFGISISLMANRVPTYFVADEFAQAVANTDIPKDFKFAELKWPLPALIFVLSDNFRRAYFGNEGAPFLSVVNAKAGDYPRDFQRFPKIDVQVPTIKWLREWIMMDYAYFGSETPITYNSTYPITDGVEVFKEASWEDATVFEYAARNTPHGLIKGELTGDAEQEFVQKAQQLALKLLLTMSIMPTCREEGKVTRHAIVTPQKVVKLPELVSPNFIGRTYKIQRKCTIVGTEGVSRAKPRFFYRRGHYAWIAINYRDPQFISVKEMPRKPEGHIDFDAAGDALSSRFRACHDRQWIEGFLFDEDDSEK
jgi:hypothetical protein